jgi:hypothetical protein
MTRVTNNATASKVRRPSRVVVALAALPMVVACAGTEPSADDPTDPSPPPTSTLPTETTESTADEIDTTTAIDTTVPTTSASVARATLPIPLNKGDRIFHASSDTVVVAHAPAPWQPFSTLGMRRDSGTAEWVGISFWDPLEVATDSCRWRDSFETPGESVAEFADALVAIPGRQATSPAPVTVGGYDGVYLEWSLPADLDLATCDDETTVAWTAALDRTRTHFFAGMIDRIWILDVDGERILIDVISLPVEQEAIRQRVDDVINSLRFVVDV